MKLTNKSIFNIVILVLTQTGWVINVQAQVDPVPLRYNSLKSEIIRVSGIVDETAYSAMAPTDRKGSVHYMDGLGRPLADISIGASNSKQDITQLYAYDQLGREDTVFLPFMALTTDGSFTTRKLNIPGQKNFYLTTTDKTEDDGFPYGVKVYENSPTNFLKENGAPGAAWQPGTNHTQRQTFRTNVANEFRRWTANLTSPGYYAAGALLVEEITDENNNKTVTVTDKLGNVLQQHVQADASVWLKTLYLYDDTNRLLYMLQPKGVQVLGTGGTISPTLVNQYAFSYVYDQRNRLVEKKSPGAAPLYYCYDPLDRLVLLQDGNMRTQNKWLFIKYDKRQHPIQKGFYLNTTYTTRTTVQKNLLDVLPYLSGETYYEYKLGGGLHSYSNQSFPQTGTEITLVNYYDDYDLNADNSDDCLYTAQSLPNESSQFKTVGLLTATKSLIIGTTQWITRYSFYDKYGRLIQVSSNNHLSATPDNLITMVYNFDGTINQTKTYHKAIAGQEVTLFQRKEYDHAGRLKKVYHKINTGAEVLLAAYEYNELGQQVDKRLSGPDNAYLQSIDYRYTIRGWLKSINNAQLITGNNNDEANDLFGMELLYNTAEAGLNDKTGDNVYYNGNIAAIKWNVQVDGTTGLSEQKSYTFNYDQASRMKSARYQAKTVASWTTDANVFNERMTYDYNGNIATLSRNRLQQGSVAFSGAPLTMDSLTYTYTGSQLSKTEDASGNASGFKNGANITTEYTYNTNGSMTADKNKGIDSIKYNLLDKVSRIKFTDGRVITYQYDADGTKLKMNTYQGTTLQSTIDYIDAFQYENGVLTFFASPEGRVIKKATGEFEYQFALTDYQGNVRGIYGNPFETGNLVTNAEATSTSGFAVVQSVSLTALTQNTQTYVRVQSNQATGKPGAYTSPLLTVKPGEKYTYKVLGYRGAVRKAYLYVSSNAGDLLWPGTLLPQGAENEGWISSDFTIPVGVTQIRVGVLWDTGVLSGDQIFINKTGLYRHIDDDYTAGFEVANQADEGGKFSNYNTGKINTSGAYSRTGVAAYRLTASTQISNEIIGPAQSIRVYPGDVVNMEVYGKYFASTGQGNTIGSSFLAAILSAFNLTPSGPTADAYTAFSSQFSAGPLIGTSGFTYDTGIPKAFINYILFDDNYVPYDFGYDQVGSDGAMPGGTADKMSLTAKVRKPGYIYIYVSNENATVTEVYFDDLSIKHVKSPLLQYNEYYPFGMQNSNTFTRAGSTGNKNLYNMGSELNSNTGWYETFFRGYDPALGRFTCMDPKAESYSGVSAYNYGLNNPVYYNDPFGADATDFVNDLWNQVPDGWKGSFQVTDGQVTAWVGYNPVSGEYAYSNSLSDGTVWNPWYREDEEKGKYSGEWMSLRSYEGVVFWMNKRNDPNVIVRQAQGSSSVILNFSNESYVLRPGSGWLYRSVCDMDEANTYLQSLISAGKAIRNLVVVGHANVEHISLGENGAGYIATDGKGNITTPETLKKLNRMIGNVSSGGNLLIVGCNADVYLGKVLQSNVRGDINIFMNSGLCNLPRYPSDTGISFNSNTVLGGSYRNITQDPNGTSPYRYISLNPNGTLNVTK